MCNLLFSRAMPRFRHFHLRLFAVCLGLAALGSQLARAATDDEDSGKSKKSRKTASSTDQEKKSEETPRRRKKSEPEPEKQSGRSGKDSGKPSEKKSSGKDSEKGTAKSDKSDKGSSNSKTAKPEKDKDSSKSQAKSEDPPRKRKSKSSEDDKEKQTASNSKETEKGTKNSSKTGEKVAEKTADKESPKKSSRKKGSDKSDKSEMTIPVSKKGSETAAMNDAKDVTDQKADRPIGERGMRDSEFDNEQNAKENAAKGRVTDKNPDKRDLGHPVESATREMQGWEVIHYQDRDWVTSSSIYRFYRFADHHMEGNVVWFTSPVLVMKAVLGSQELLINNIKFILSNPVEEVNGKVLFSRLDLCKLIDPVLRPSYIGRGQPFDTVIVDAGHGGYDSGARGIYGYEKNFTLQLAGQLRADLERRGFKVVLTRSDDTFISLGGRVEFANKVPNSIFVSLHFNSGQSAATGIETYALSPQGASSDYGARSVDALAFSGNQRDSENIALATAIHAAVVHHFKLVDRGVKRARWYVLTGLERPGVLFEGGFVTNNGDGQLIAAENFRRELAHTIGDAISNYRRALSPSSGR
jgi:N-acetylmuramoyl-L-alanine amidase